MTIGGDLAAASPHAVWCRPPRAADAHELLEIIDRNDLIARAQIVAEIPYPDAPTADHGALPVLEQVVRILRQHACLQPGAEDRAIAADECRSVADHAVLPPIISNGVSHTVGEPGPVVRAHRLLQLDYEFLVGWNFLLEGGGWTCARASERKADEDAGPDIHL